MSAEDRAGDRPSSGRQPIPRALSPGCPRGSEPTGDRVKVTTRPASPEDYDFAREAHHAAYRDVIERQFGNWEPERQHDFFVADWEPAATAIILLDDVRSGYWIVEHRTKDIHLRELVIHPDFQGRGIGTTLLRMLQRDAAARGVPIRLGTFHQNRAQDLYARPGFRAFDSTDTHVLMEWRPEADTR